MADKIIQMKDGADNVYPVTAAADYVVDQGTSTVSGVTWTYEKWDSGKAECRCSFTTSVTSSTAVGSMYYSSIISATLPFNVSNAVISGNSGKLCYFGNATVDNGAVTFRLVCPSAFTLNSLVYDVQVCVTGTWK